MMRTDSVWLGVAEGADEPLSPCYTSSSISHMPRTPASAVIVATSSLGSRRERRDQGHGPEFSTSNASGRDVRWSPAPARRDSLRSAGPVGGGLWEARAQRGWDPAQEPASSGPEQVRQRTRPADPVRLTGQCPPRPSARWPGHAPGSFCSGVAGPSVPGACARGRHVREGRRGCDPGDTWALKPEPIL